jgi:hypothetical protein
LGAASLDHPQEGLDARDRGILVHAALAELWSELTTQQRLISMPQDPLASVIAAAVDRALARLRRRRASSFGTRFLELERARLIGLLEEWLQIERQRSDFTVAVREEAAVVNVAGLVLSLQLDRVDHLSAGGDLLTTTR